MQPEDFQRFLHKPVDRREFLAHVGASALAIIGVGGLIKAITNPPRKNTQPRSAFNDMPRQSKQAVSSGYGSSRYGV